MAERYSPQLKLEQARYVAYIVDNNEGAKIDHNGANQAEVLATKYREGLNGGISDLPTNVWCEKETDYVRQTRDTDVVVFLQSNNADEELVQRYFYGNKFKKQETIDADIYSMGFDELSDHMETKVAGIYELVENSLHNGHKYGFNRHDLEHVRKVKNRLISLLKASDADDETIRIGIIAAYTHDMGNLLSRKYHSLASAEMLDYIMPELDQDPGFKRRVRRAVQLHNEPIALAMIGSILKDLNIENPDESPEEFYLLMRKRFGDEGLALLIADKSDALDRSRVSMKVGNGNVVNNDKHYEDSLLAHSFPVIVESGSAAWNIQFNPNLTKDDPYHSVFKSKEGSERAIISEKTKTKRKQEELPYFYSWINSVMDSNLERFRLATYATFALFPNIDQMSIRINDKDGFVDELQGLHVVFGFMRNRPNEAFTFMKKLQNIETIKSIYQTQKRKVIEHFEKYGDLFIGNRVDGTFVDENESMKIFHVFSKKEEVRALEFLRILYGDAVLDKRKLAEAGD